MKNKSRIFSPGLYLEGIRQTRYVGLPYICFVLLCEAYCLIQSIVDRGSDTPYIALITSYLSFCVVIPISALSLFHFLNSRAGSDFYHSIPIKRNVLYTSYAASIMTWSVGGVVLAVLSQILMGAGGMSPSALDICARSLLYAAICGFLVLSACLLGMTVSGNLISQIAIIGLILFLPRVIIAIAAADVSSNVYTLPDVSDHLGGFFNYRINMLFESLFSTLFGSGSVITWQSVVYTVVLGAIYFFAGMKLFGARKSEKASYPAVSRYVQSAARVLVAFIICLIADQNIISKLANRREYFDLAEIVLVYGFAVVAYFVYEIISSRSVRGLRNSWKELLIGLAVLAAVNAVFVAGTLGMINGGRSYLPDRDSIDHISIGYYDPTYGSPSYNEVKAYDIKLDDPETIDIAYDTLKHDNQAMRQSSNLPSKDQYVVCFTLKNGTVKRRILYFTAAEYERFNRKLLENEQFRDAVNDIPADETVTDISVTAISAQYYEKVWSQFSEELRGLSVKERALISENGYNIFSDDGQDADVTDSANKSTYCLGELEIAGRLNGELYRQVYRITPLTPKTAEIYMELVNTQNDPDNVLEITDIRKFLKTCANYRNYNINLTVDGGNLYDEDGNYIFSSTQSYQAYKWYDEDGGTVPEVYADQGLKNGGLERLLDELERNYANKPDISRPFYKVDIYLEYTLDKDGSEEIYGIDRTFFVNADPVDPMIKEWVMNYTGFEDEDAAEAEGVSGSDAK